VRPRRTRDAKSGKGSVWNLPQYDEASYGVPFSTTRDGCAKLSPGSIEKEHSPKPSGARKVFISATSNTIVLGTQ
jgi:hypothetical protein